MTSLMAASGLPTDDLSEQDQSLLLVEGSGDTVSAIGGLERCGDTALIRSVATSSKMRGQGIARAIVEELEELAAGLGIREPYLLTESAEGYFESLGYVKLDRANVPQPVRESRQFPSLCPDSATVHVQTDRRMTMRVRESRAGPGIAGGKQKKI